MTGRPVQPHSRNRKAVAPHQRGADAIATITIAATKARLTFDRPIVLSGTPLTITRQAAGSGPQLLPTAAAQVSAQIIDLTYAASVVATDVLTIPAGVPELRTHTGGFPASQVHTFS